MKHKLLTENEIIEHVSKYLVTRHYRIERTANTREHGIDIVAEGAQNKQLWIEAKGQTSSKPDTARSGKEFSRNQKEDHLGRALLKCCQYLSARPDVLVGLAIPGDKVDLELMQSIEAARSRLGLFVFLVEENRYVRVVSDLPDGGE